MHTRTHPRRKWAPDSAHGAFITITMQNRAMKIIYIASRSHFPLRRQKKRAEWKIQRSAECDRHVPDEPPPEAVRGRQCGLQHSGGEHARKSPSGGRIYWSASRVFSHGPSARAGAACGGRGGGIFFRVLGPQHPRIRRTLPKISTAASGPPSSCPRTPLSLSGAARLRGRRRGRLLDAGAVGLLLCDVSADGPSLQHRCRRRTDCCLHPVEAAAPRWVTSAPPTTVTAAPLSSLALMRNAPWAIRRFLRTAFAALRRSIVDASLKECARTGNKERSPCVVGFFVLLIRIIKYSLVKAIFGWIACMRLNVSRQNRRSWNSCAF